MEEKLDTSQQCALTAQKAKHILDSFKREMSSRWSKVVLLLNSAFVGPHLRAAFRSRASPEHKKDMDLLEQVQRRATKVIRGMEHLPYGDRLRELTLFSLEKRRLLGDLIAVFQYLKKVYKKGGRGIFILTDSDRTRGNSFNLKRIGLD